MATVRIERRSNLSGVSDDNLDEIAADGHVFSSAGWFRLLDRLDLSAITGGAVELEYAVVAADDAPIAICPILRARGEGIYFVYSLRRYFFEHWIEDAVRLDPSKRDSFARIMTGVSLYQRLLRWTGARLEDALIVTNPLSYRCHIPVAPSSPEPRSDVHRGLIAFLQRHARTRRLPLWFLGVEGTDSRWTGALEAAGCARVFHFYDNQAPVESFGSFDDYLGSFRRTTRRAFVRDIRRAEQAGVRFRFVDDFDRMAVEFARLYQQTYSKYGASYFRHPPEFWRQLRQCLGASAEAIIAEAGDELVGFSLLLKSERRGELWTYRMGRSETQRLADVPFYFGLSYYGPIQRAIELGYRRVWLGPASYEAKSVRGARQVPLYSFFWFPRQCDRWLLAPYLKLFGKVSEEEIAKSIARPIRVEAPESSEAPRSPKDNLG